MGLRTEISFNLKIVIFLPVTLNPRNNSHKPFCKSNVIPTYINVNSNPTASLDKQIPDMIILELTDCHLLKTYLIIIRISIMKLYVIVVEYLDANKLRGNNIGNKGHNYRGNDRT